jgi:hypothetical protein
VQHPSNSTSAEVGHTLGGGGEALRLTRYDISYCKCTLPEGSYTVQVGTHRLSVLGEWWHPTALPGGGGVRRGRAAGTHWVGHCHEHDTLLNITVHDGALCGSQVD